jgi:hypothetical protein
MAVLPQCKICVKSGNTIMAEVQKGRLFNYLTIVGVMLEWPDLPRYQSGSDTSKFPIGCFSEWDGL